MPLPAFDGVAETSPKEPSCCVMSAKRPLNASVVLVVEDNELVRVCAIEILEDAGLAAVEACNADEAWAILKRRPDIGVLFTDIDMPGSMCGVTLAARVHASWPDIRLVLTSGRKRPAEEEIPDHGRFVAKPYGTRDIVEAIVHAR